MKKLTLMPTIDLCPTYCEQVSETEVIHYKLPHQLTILNKNNKEILENYFKEEVEITDSEEKRPGIYELRTAKVPENIASAKPDRMFHKISTIVEPTFIQKIKLNLQIRFIK